MQILGQNVSRWGQQERPISQFAILCGSGKAEHGTEIRNHKLAVQVLGVFVVLSKLTVFAAAENLRSL